MSTWNKRKRKRVGWNNNNKSTIAPKKRKHNLDSSSNDNLWSNPESCLSWLLSSKNTNNLPEFITNYWCKKPYLLQRNNEDYYKSKGINIDLNTVYKIIEKHDGEFTFGENVICKYYNKQNKTEINAVNRGEIVKLNEIKTLFNNKENGATIQLLHSHFYHYEIGHIIFNLESYFGNFVSSNVYITPNNKQGLKPHWDDIEAFVLQIKGKKHWKLYEINEINDQYPINESYKNLNIENKNKYSLIMECILSPGDILYFPRGIVHFAECVESKNENDYSLHITISTNQNNSYGQFIKLMMNKYMDEMIKNNIKLRQNIPINIIKCIGNELNINKLNKMQKDTFQKNIYNFMNILKTNVFSNKNKQNELMDNVMDNIGVEFVSKRYPPPIFLKPNQFIIYGNKNNQIIKKNVIEPKMCKKDELIEYIEDNNKRDMIINQNSMIRLVNINWMRFIDVNGMDLELDNVYTDMDDQKMLNSFLEEDINDENDENDNDLINVNDENEYGNLLLYSCVRNNHKTHLMAYKEDMSSEPMITNDNDKIVFCLLNEMYPKWIKVKQLKEKCSECDEKRIYDLLFALWAEGLLETDKYK